MIVQTTYPIPDNEQVHEIVKACPTERQTMLFSATMGTKVDDLIKLSLIRPVRIAVSAKKRGATSEGGMTLRLPLNLSRNFFESDQAMRASARGLASLPPDPILHIPDHSLF